MFNRRITSRNSYQFSRFHFDCELRRKIHFEVEYITRYLFALFINENITALTVKKLNSLSENVVQYPHRFSR